MPALCKFARRFCASAVATLLLALLLGFAPGASAQFVPPPSLSASDNQANQITVTIQNAGTNSWRLRRDTTIIRSWSGSGNITHHDTGATGSHTYRLERPCINEGCWTWDIIASGSGSLLQAPAVPGSISATNTRQSDIQISWGSAARATSYTLQRRAVGGSYATVRTQSGTSWTDTGATPGVSYEYRVRASNAAGDSSWRGTASGYRVLPTPAQPGSISYSNTTSNSIPITWGASSNATTFRIQRSVNGGGYVTVRTQSASSTRSWTDTNVSHGNTYVYRVRGENTDRNGSYRTGPTVSARYPVPGTPGSIGYSVNAGAMSLSWGSAANATSYEVQRSVNGGGYSTVRTQSGTSWTDSSISPGNDYRYRVRGVNPDEPGGYRTGDTVRYPFADAAVPGSISTSLSGTAMAVSWSAANNASNYRVERQANGGAWEVVRTQSATSWSDSSIVRGNDYRYRVRAENADSQSGYRTGLEVRFPLATPAVPGAIEATLSGASVDVSWSAAANASSYRLERRVNGGGWETRSIQSTTSLSDSAIDRGNNYTYRVRAENVDAVSAYRSAADVRFPLLAPAVPGGLTATTTHPDHVALAWSAASGATGYRIQRRTSGGSWSAIASSANTTHLDTSAIAGTAYEYRVRAENVDANSAYGQAVGGERLAVPPTPAGLFASQGDFTDRVELSWGASARTDLYRIFRDGAPIGTTTEPAFDDATATPGVVHDYRVRAENVAGNSALSATAQGYALAPPATPGGLAAGTRSSADHIRVTWNHAEAAAAYRVYRGTQPNGSDRGVLTSNLPGTLFEDTTAVADATYYYWVASTNAAGSSALAGPVSGVRLGVPGAPQGVAATTRTHTEHVALSWAAVAHAASYRVYRNTEDSATGRVEIASGIGASAYNDTGAIAGTRYHYWVRAENAAGLSGFSASASGERLAAPMVPTGLSASQATHADRITLSWEGVATASTYRITRNATVIATTTSPEYSDTDVAAGTTYSYRVRAENAAGHSAYSQAASGLALPAPGGVEGLTASVREHADRVALNWGAVEFAASYRVYRNTSAETAGREQIASGVSATGYNDTSATPGTHYTYWVRAENAAGLGAYSEAVSGERLATPPAPAGLSVTQADLSDRVELSWSASAQADGYRVYRDEVLIASTTSALTYTDTEVVPGQRYSYHVVAENAAGDSPRSSVVEGYSLPVPATPTGLSAGEGTSTEHVALSWQAVEFANTYQVLRDGVLIATVSATAYLDAAIEPNTIHSYRVVAENAAGSSAASAPAQGYRLAPAAAPQGLSASDGSHTTHVALSWQPMDFAESYEIERDGSVIATVSTPGYQDTTAVANTTHRYRVRAVNAAGTSAYSSHAEGLRLGVAQPPTGVSASQATHPARITVSWQASAYADTYTLERDGVVIATVGTTSYQDSAVDPLVAHSYRVRAVNAAGISEPSVLATGMRLGVVAPPADLAAANGESADYVALSWSAVALAASYEIRRDGSVIATVSQSGYQDTGASAGVSHSYTVASVNAAGTSEPSATVSGLRLIAPEQPQTISATTSRLDGIAVSWSETSWAGRYDLYRNGEFLTALIDTTYLDTDLAPGESASYSVRAVNAAGASQASAGATGQRAAGGFQFRSGMGSR
ncbi:fibronectin type 3 domain-containing protein [Natronocella acetinitrilica]|uniref:Fibronectin type 3 domain-containing protein n=1 Tax=Natronocella acetinitrilica TaxID=414046 RepID=A0AAE3KBA3_9GAMM|nr:hypothetical protein [Natronocella acetinitrilica]MCP1674569.1 fibronectin type 3 domain-containing protein [Natronocella acetinitrilica]